MNEIEYNCNKELERIEIELLYEEGLYEKTKIYATDINSEVLKSAKSGVFPINQMWVNTNNYIKAGGKKPFRITTP